ncbi:MAG: trypsin-like peptidase domain-containing protein [Lachnospiraceae bacterium]|nr:trypsin-like peptidase domain-containing protein [Lachnospiraceae bacterium]
MSDNFDYNYDDKKEETVTKAQPKEKKGHGKLAKFFGTVFLACVFGLSASVVFNVTDRVIDRIDQYKNPRQEAKNIEEKTIEDKFDNKDVAPEKPEKKDKEDNVEKKALNTNDVARDQGVMTVTDVVSEAMPSIVAITNKSIQDVRLMYGMGIQKYESESAGSGIIVGQNDTELLIVTNAHVVKNANTLTVCFIDGEAYEANLKGSDEENDLAVITVSLDDVSGSTLKEIKVAKIGNSDDLQIGEQVVAIGNAMGYGQSVTTGIISALNRTMGGDEEGNFYIQTDAAINPGNSGGALLNMKGEVVGINSAKLANTLIEGMGYAIPISSAGSIMEDLMNMVSRTLVDEAESGYLGISGFSVTDEVANAYSIPKGIYVSETSEGTAAEKAGIKKGDVILKFDGMSMDSINKLKERLMYYKAGETVDVIIARADNGEYKEKTIPVTLGRKETLEEDSKDPQSDKTEESSDYEEDEPEPNNGQRNGQFNFGGSTFEYSIPNNIFDFFGR